MDSPAGTLSAPPPLDPSVRWPSLLAAVDMGSNSFRLEIGEVARGGRYRRIDYLKETVRLGGGLDDNGHLTESAVLRGLDCLGRFAQRLRGFALHQVRAVATQTLREARNRDAFLLQAQTTLGYPIEVISGREEARLIYAGVARLQPSDRPRLVIDIGGRSTEMILGHGRHPRQAESFQVGSVSLSMKYFPEGRYTEAGFRAAQIAAGAELEEALEPFARQHWTEALGSSGTVGAVAQLLVANGVSKDGSITPDGLRWCMEQCLQAQRHDDLALAGLKPERRAVLGGGLAILYTLAVHFGIDRLLPTRGALRQGVIFDLDERLDAARSARHKDMRDASVHQLQRRFGVDEAQAGRVQQIALQLYHDAWPEADLEAVRELGWSAALHEIGMMVSHHDHHRHSAYLLAHVDAPGFSQSQQRRVGELVLGQRGGLRKLETAMEQESVAWQVLCLRLAVILCHARGDVSPQAARLHRSSRSALLALDARWAEAHPRTLHLLNEEVDTWNRGGVLRVALQSR